MGQEVGVRPPRCVLDKSVHQPTQWTEANVAHLSVTHLGGHAQLRGRFPKRLVTANHTTPGSMSWHLLLTLTSVNRQECVCSVPF